MSLVSNNFILLGDFNVDVLSNSYLSNHLNNICIYSFHLTQVMTEPTHAKPNGTSFLIDLVLMSDPEPLSECVTVPPLANSDHLGVSLCINYRMCSKKKSRRKHEGQFGGMSMQSFLKHVKCLIKWTLLTFFLIIYMHEPCIYEPVLGSLERIISLCDVKVYSKGCACTA